MNNGNKPRQINRVATPIKVDNKQIEQESQPNQVVTEQQPREKTVTKQVENTMKQIPPKKKAPVKKEKKVKKVDNHDPTMAVFGMILLLIFTFLVAFLGLYIVPRYLQNQNRVKYNDKTTSPVEQIDNQIVVTTLAATSLISEANSYNVEGKFNVGLVSNGTNLDVMINNKKITSSDYLLPAVATVDDLVLFTVQNKEARTTKLYAVTEAGEVVLELYDILGEDGMVIMPNSSSIIYNSVSIVVLGSRVNGGSLILDNEFGKTNGLNICSTDVLSDNNIDDEYHVYGTYSFEYIGDHKFSDPVLIGTTSLSQYKTQEGLCK